MKIPVRIISVATTVFWIFLIIFSASAIYSMKDVQFILGEPNIERTAPNELLFSFPVSVFNTGYYSLRHFNLSTSLFSREGLEVAEGSSLIVTVPPGQVANATHNMTLNLSRLIQIDRNLLLNDTELRANLNATMEAAEVIPVGASSNISFPWGAPLSNLLFGVPEINAFNATHVQVRTPFSFENHAFFDVTGEVRLCLFDSANVLISEGRTFIDASQHSAYHDTLLLNVPLSTSSGQHLEVYISAPFFAYGPVVLHYGG